MVDASGGRHAHRIYLAPGGGGKAELGRDSKGAPRNPKKSATALRGDRISGRAAFWGNPTAAERLILCEGIETGASLAFAFASDLKDGTTAVAAAISAAGVEAFAPYLCTRRITVAADRDEASKDGAVVGTRRGEQAARRFAMRQFGNVDVAIALPGEPGEKIDFLDILCREGAKGLRAAVNCATPFEPTTDDREDLTRDLNCEAELEKTAKIYPVPHLENLELVYAHAQSGRVKLHRVGRARDQESSTSEKFLTAVASPFGVPARLRKVDQADEYAMRVLVQDMDGKPRNVDFDRAMLAKRGAPDVLAPLFAAGLRLEADGEMIVLQWLKAAAPDQEIVVMDRPGWQEHPGIADPVFVSPDGTVFGTPDGTVLELAANARIAPEHAESGNLQCWQEAIRAALSVPACPHWAIGAFSSFAGVIASLTDIDTCGINLSGLSTSGKTTAQRLAVSAWSTPDIRKPGLLQSARSTVNAAEALAHRATGTILALDELAHLDGKELARLIYMLAGGVGKGRMNADSTIRSTQNWVTFAILSSEISLGEKIEKDNGQWSMGMAVRFPDVDVADVNRYVDADILEKIDGINKHYGHAGPAFVRALFEAGIHRHPLELRNRIMQAARALAGEASDSAITRAATPFAILFIAGELAKSFGLLPESCDVRLAIDWAWGSFRRSSDSIALDPEEQAIGNIRGYIAKMWNVTIIPTKFEFNPRSRSVEGWHDDNAVYLPRESLLRAAGGSIRDSKIGQFLSDRDLLFARDKDRYTVQQIPGFKKLRAYALKRPEFGRVERPPDPTDSDVE